ncbi:MAG: bifunctional nuclease family protein [Phycisphaerales bacterium JB039]
MAVRMELSRILIRELNDFQIIELREVVDDEEGGRAFPISIGLPEAQAIERRLSGVVVKRPQTHDLLANVIQTLGAELQSVTVTDLADGTFYATLDVRTAADESLHIDARPSDAIALGIGIGVPIYVEEHVLEGVRDGEPD